jgi:hypothetical protein
VPLSTFLIISEVSPGLDNEGGIPCSYRVSVVGAFYIYPDASFEIFPVFCWYLNYRIFFLILKIFLILVINADLNGIVENKQHRKYQDETHVCISLHSTLLPALISI